MPAKPPLIILHATWIDVMFVLVSLEEREALLAVAGEDITKALTRNTAGRCLNSGGW